MIEEHEQAVADFNFVIKKNPKNANAYFRRAFSLKSLRVSSKILLSTNHRCHSLPQRYQEAVDDFEKAKQLDPMNERLMVNYKKLKGVQCIVLCEPGDEKDFN